MTRMRPNRPRGRATRRAAASWLAVAFGTLLSITSASALEFRCIEPSRYRNLLSVFNDDPNLFFSHLGLPRGRLPDLNTCRALLITGTLATGDSDALLDRIIAAKGWLAVLYLSLEGANIEEEARIASIVREFSLKTRAVRQSLYRYQPDFARLWEPPIALTGTSAAAPPARDDISPLHRGLQAYAVRRDLALPLDANHSTCNDGCRPIWFAGVNRLYNAAPAGAPAPSDVADPVNARLRVALTYFIDLNRLPAADDPVLSKPLGWTSATPPATARMLRDKCNPEFAVAESLETRFGEAFETAARSNLRPREVQALTTPFEALSRSGARLQQCLAAALEGERLASFGRQCAPACDRQALSERFAGAARDILGRAGQP